VSASQVPYVHQFLNGETDGPVPFHYPAAAFRSELLEAGHG
jgi:phospholipid/cholesterol/gamma-HCH transport system ATP-binding protein